MPPSTGAGEKTSKQVSPAGVCSSKLYHAAGQLKASGDFEVKRHLTKEDVLGDLMTEDDPQS